MCGAKLDVLSLKQSDGEQQWNLRKQRLNTIGTALDYKVMDGTEYRERRDTLVTELNKIEGVVVSKPKGAFYCMHNFRLKCWWFCAMAIGNLWFKRWNRNGSASCRFYSTPGMGLNQVRIAYVLKKDLIVHYKIIKTAYQSITQGKVIAKGLKISFKT
jgi:aspartate/methionine/tyrosine aminotransferase